MFHAFKMASLLVLLCSLAQGALGQLPRAQAAPKTIAIVNLSEAPEAGKTTRMARSLIDTIPGLRPSAPGDLARALEDPLPADGPDALVVRQAEERLVAAEESFEAFQSNATRAQLERARSLLFTVAPSETTTHLLADLSFRMALLHLRDDNRGLAMNELQLLHRLDERTTIDPVRYPPDVVRAFRIALREAPREENATLRISTTYDGAPVFLDGRPVGKAPLQLAITSGVHIVAVAAPQYQAAAQKIVVDPGAVTTLNIDLEPRKQASRALELRFAAVRAGLGEDDLRAAAKSVARMLGSDAVLVITSSSAAGEGQAVMAQLYLPTLDRLSFSRRADRQLENLLAILVEVPRPALVDQNESPSEQRWYKRPVIMGALVVLLTAAGAGVYAVTADDGSQPPVMVSTEWF